ncbi:Ribosomally synthesized peptide with nif11-like leader [Methylorubrum aminovorans]
MLHSFDMSDDDLSERLSKTNTALAEWAARSACESDALIERFERMGYEVRGKSVDEITEVLKRPPTNPSHG